MQTDFLAFHSKHPEVYDSLVSLARMTKAAGISKYGIRDLVAVCRWQATLRDKKFRVRNSFTPYYARLIQLQEPDLKGFFITSHSESDTDFGVAGIFGDGRPSGTIYEVAAAMFIGRPLKPASNNVFALT